MKIAKIIKYEGDNKTFIWKHPEEDFNNLTQLIVHESQEAIFFMNGQALDLFGPGAHTLESQNIPLVNKYFNKATENETPFHCEIYFINKAEQMAIKWGTGSKIQYMEPTYNFPISIGLSGEMSIYPENSRKLLIKLVGTENFLGQEKLNSFIRSIMMTKIKSYIAKIMRINVINIFQIDENLDVFSEELKSYLISDYSDYGLVLQRFQINTVVKPDGDSQYEKFKELHFRQYADITEAKLRQKVEIIDQQTDAHKIVIKSKAMAQKRQQEGYSYQQERGFDVAEKVATNEGSGNFTSAGMGLGMMAGVGGVVGSAVSGTFNQAVTPITVDQAVHQDKQEVKPKGFCENCGFAVDAGALFCEECGKSLADSKPACKMCGYIFERKGKFCPKCGGKRDGENYD